MIHKSLHLLLPNQKPFDKDNWFESFVGNFVKPIFETDKIQQFWFSRYGRRGEWEVRFRFTLNDYEEIEPFVQDLLRNFSITDLHDEEHYNWVGDLGSSRYLENNQRQTNNTERAQLVLDYLHSVSRLFVDTLSHSDDGYFYQEKNTNSNNPHGSIFESLHHLFCNTTAVYTEIIDGELNGKRMVNGSLYFHDWYLKEKANGNNPTVKAKYRVFF